MIRCYKCNAVVEDLSHSFTTSTGLVYHWCPAPTCVDDYNAVLVIMIPLVMFG